MKVRVWKERFALLVYVPVLVLVCIVIPKLWEDAGFEKYGDYDGTWRPEWHLKDVNPKFVLSLAGFLILCVFAWRW